MSEIRATTISDAAGTGPITLTGQRASQQYARYTLKTTAAITSSFNTSSLTDVGTGIGRLAFTNSFDNADYFAATAVGEADGGGNRAMGLRGSGGTGPTTSTVQFATFNSSWGLSDDNFNCEAIIGDLA